MASDRLSVGVSKGLDLSGFPSALRPRTLDSIQRHLGRYAAESDRFYSVCACHLLISTSQSTETHLQRKASGHLHFGSSSRFVKKQKSATPRALARENRGNPSTQRFHVSPCRNSATECPAELTRFPCAGCSQIRGEKNKKKGRAWILIPPG